MERVVTTPVDYRTRLLAGLAQLPPFSPVINKLLASLAYEDVSFAEIGHLIEKDTVLSGNVLRLVNSAFYARRGTITSISHAVSILGLVKIRNLVLGMSIARMWAPPKMPQGWSQARFNQHAVATAVLSDLVAQHGEVEYPEGAFIAGLLHDFGKLLIVMTLPHEYAEIQDLYGISGRTREECEREVLGLDHGEVSALTLEKWNLPLPIQEAVEHHHHTLPLATPLRLAGVVGAMSQCATRMGIALDPANTPNLPPEDCLEGLVEKSKHMRVLEEFHRDFDSIKGFF
jgi:HD-like signal output (HDOD) protein